MNFTLRTFLVALLLLSWNAFSVELRFNSGLPKAVSLEAESVEKVMADEFGRIQPLEWKPAKRQEDSTHVHLTYDLYFHEYPVFFQHLKVHYNKAGFVDYLTSTLQNAVEIPNLPERHSWEEQRNEAAAILFGRKSFSGIIRGKLGIWLDEKQEKAEWAFYLEAVSKGAEGTKSGVVSLENPRVLEERNLVRNFNSQVSVQTFTPFPVPETAPKKLLGGGVTKLIGSDDADKLKNEFVYVRYDREPGENYSEVGSTSGIDLSSDEENDYAFDCDASTNTCNNQKIDAGNVYYHLTKYRTWLNSQAASFGSTLSFPYDPIPVFINFMAISIEKDCGPNGPSLTKTEQSNQAAYYGGLCDSSGANDHCLVFLRYSKTTPCLPNMLYDPGGSFAREALIGAHEYQHYTTDMISGIEFGGEKNIRVGDVIHEGYSDYLAASYVTSENNGTSVYKVGEYAFQNKYSDLIRDLSVKKVFDQSASYSSAHAPGWVWASALWELRSLIGSSTTDLIALKSLFYLSTTPGFIDSVEALVQADKSITGGTNERTIRRVLFDERKFLGSLTGAFQDEDKKILKVGFQGCAHVNPTKTDSSFPVLGVFLLWLVTTLWGGKRLWKSQ